MYCPYCGTNLVANASFCSGCGKSIVGQGAPSRASAERDAIRQKSLDLLNKALSHFSAKGPVYDLYDEACSKVNYYARGASSALIVWGSIILGFGIFITFASYFMALIPMLILSGLPGFFMIIAGILVKTGNRRNISKWIDQYAYLSVELYNHYLAYPGCPIAPEYSNPKIISALIQNVQSGSSATVQEAANQLFWGRNREAIDRYLTRTAKNTAQINEQTDVPAIFIPAKLRV